MENRNRVQCKLAQAMKLFESSRVVASFIIHKLQLQQLHLQTEPAQVVLYVQYVYIYRDKHISRVARHTSIGQNVAHLPVAD